jgi:hypothetical protein
MRFRKFEPSSVGDQRLIDLLRKAAGRIVADFYGMTLETGLDNLFKGLTEDDIRQIRVVQTYLLDHMPASLRQFDLSAQPQLCELLRRMDAVHRLQVEEYVLDEEKRSIKRKSDQQRRQVQQEFRERKSDQQRRQVQQEFLKALKDPAVRDALLNAVRRKMNEHYQYQEDSVPFELLQNADDACVEFKRLGGIPGDWFTIARDGDSLAFLHAGRPINVTGPGDRKLRDSGFDRDLEKMLMLSTSDKQTGAETSTVTGKFGLGFKSVFLVSDHPCALSRTLGFQVAGALLPLPLPAEDRKRLEDRFKEVTDRHIRDIQGTIFALPLRPEVKSEKILGRFRRLLPVLLAFTQHIRKCHLHGLFPEPKTTEWSETPVSHAEGWSVGTLDSPDPDSLVNKQRAVVLRLDAKKAVLLGLNTQGFTALPDDVPSIWVTAPTGHKEKIGVALNAPFALDVGRAQLGRDNQTRQALVDELGVAIGGALERLYTAVDEHWDDVRQALGLLTGEKKGLWHSLWLVLGETMANRAQHSDREDFGLLKRIFWGSATHGIARLYEEKLALPTGLDVGPHAVLTKRRRITQRLTGCLDEEKGLRMFELAAGWAHVKARLAPGNIISGLRVWRALRHPGAVEERQASPIDLSHLICWELEADSSVTPARATQFAMVINPDLLQRLEKVTSGVPEAHRLREELTKARPEADRLRDELTKARFRCRKGTEVPAERLLVAAYTNADRRDETRRAAFAPADRILSDDYQGTALDFFFACRPALQAQVHDLIAWGRAAEGEQRTKFLEYLHDGDLASPLSRALRQQTKDNDWWKKADEFETAASHAQGEIDKGFVRAVVGQVPQQLPPAGGAERDHASVLDACDVLTRLAEWWQRDRTDWLCRYRDWVYPGFLHPSPTFPYAVSLSQDDLATDLSVRKRWLSLFILGMTHALGRGGQYGLQHRDFLKLCESEGWLDVFADPSVNDRRAEWIAVIDNYVGKQQADAEYYNWLRQLFISIRVVAVRLGEYAEAFRALRSKDVRLSDVLRPRNSWVFQRGGVDPPSLARVLSLGACFVARELVRGGFIPADRRQVHLDCYPPVRSVRRLLGALEGCPNLEGDEPDSWKRSAMIHCFLAQHIEPTFGGDFDIPLWLVSRVPDLYRQFLRRDPASEDTDEERW